MTILHSNVWLPVVAYFTSMLWRYCSLKINVNKCPLKNNSYAMTGNRVVTAMLKLALSKAGPHAC